MSEAQRKTLFTQVKVPSGGRLSSRISEQALLEILNSAVSEMNNYTKKIDAIRLEDQVGFLFAERLDYKIKSNTTARKEFEWSIQRGAAYLIVNQIVFYIVLSREVSDWRELREIKNPRDLQAYFDKVLAEKKYRPIFGARIAPLLSKEAVHSLNKIIRIIKHLQLELTKRDILGKVFQSLIPHEMRKRIAAYYTSNASAELLARLSIDHKDAFVLDPACGSGTLLLAAYKRKRELHKRDDQSLHRKLLKEIFGIDVSLFAAHLAAIQLSIQGPLNCTEDVNIILSDAFRVTTRPLSLAPAYDVGLQATKEEVLTVPKVDIIIMNPPFTKYGRLEKSYRKFLKRALLLKKTYIRRQMGLQCFFLIHVDDFLAKDGKVAAVLPAATFYASYAEGVRKMLVEKYKVEYIISSDVQETFSEQCDFKEVLFIASKANQSNEMTKFVTLKVPLTLDNYSQIADRLRSITTDFEDHQLRVNTVTRKQLESEWNWMTFTHRKEFALLLERIHKLADNKLTEGRKLFQGIKRGFETYGPEVFFIPNRVWTITEENENEVIIEKNDQTKRSLSLPKRFLIRAMRRPKLYMNIITPKINHYVLSIPEIRPESLPTDIRTYLEWGEKQNIKAFELQKKRKTSWFSFIYRQLRREELFGRLALVRKFRITTSGVLMHYFGQNVTASKGFYLITSGDQDLDMALAAWFNSTIFIAEFLRVKRAIEGAWSELMIEDLKKIPCLNVKEIKSENVENLKEVLLEISRIVLPPIPCQIGEPYRRKLDEAVFRALEIPDSQDILEKLYGEINNQFLAYGK